MGVVLDGRCGGWDGMAWHGMTGATARGRGGLASSLLVAQRSGSLTVAWQRATLHGPGPPSRPSSMAWHGMARRPPGGKRGEPGGSRRGRGFRWGAGTRASSPGVGEGTRGARGAGLGRPRAFASWQQKMDRWEAPRRGGNQGEGAGRRGQAPPCVGPRGTQGAPRPLWLAWRMVRFAGRRAREGALGGGRERGRDWTYICMSVSGPEEPCPESTSWTGVEGGVAPCRAPTRYISPPNAMTHVKKPASSLAACVPPQATLRGAWPRPGGAPGASTPPPAKGTCPCVLLTGAAALRGAASLGPRGPGDHHTEPLTGATGPRGGPLGLGGTGARAL